MGIKKLIFEGDLEEVATTVDEASTQNLAFYLKKTAYGYKGVLYSTGEMWRFFQELPKEAVNIDRSDAQNFRGKVVYGTFTANFEPGINGYEIDTMAALNSYGPLMYDILSSYAGWIIRDTAGITNAAKKVWKYIFERRNDWEFEWAPEEFRVNNKKANPLNYKYRIKTPIRMTALLGAHKAFVNSVDRDPGMVEDSIARFGSAFFDEMYD